MEHWEVHPDYPGYSFSTQGRVRNDNRGSMLSIIGNGRNQAFVAIMQDGRQVRRGLAKLICETFLDKPQPFFDTPIHLNGDRQDFRLANLAWRPRWFAYRHSRQFHLALGTHSPIRNKQTGEVYEDIWPLVIAEGLLYMDVLMSPASGAWVFPTQYTYEWVK